MPIEPRSRYPVELHEEAAAEYDQAFDWYLSRSADSALRFDAEVDRGLAQISSAPHRWPQGFFMTRKYLYDRLPFHFGLPAKYRWDYSNSCGCAYQPQAGVLERTTLVCADCHLCQRG